VFKAGNIALNPVYSPNMATIFTKSGIAQRTASTSSNTSSGENFGDYNDAKLPAVSISSESSIPPLGETETTKKFWFQKSVKTDLNAIATQVNRSE
jgi:hypothetical protein